MSLIKVGGKFCRKVDLEARAENPVLYRRTEDKCLASDWGVAAIDTISAAYKLYSSMKSKVKNVYPDRSVFSFNNAEVCEGIDR